MSEKIKQTNAENIETLTENSSENLVEAEAEVNDSTSLNLICKVKDKNNNEKDIILNPFWLAGNVHHSDNLQALKDSFRKSADLRVPNLIDMYIKNASGDIDETKQDPGEINICCLPHSMNGFLKNYVEGIALWGKDEYSANNRLYYNDPEDDLQNPLNLNWNFDTSNNFDNLNASMPLNIYNPNYFPMFFSVISDTALSIEHTKAKILEELENNRNSFGCFDKNMIGDPNVNITYLITWDNFTYISEDSTQLKLNFYYNTPTKKGLQVMTEKGVPFTVGVVSDIYWNAKIILPANWTNIYFKQSYRGSEEVSGFEPHVSDKNYVNNIKLNLTPIIKQNTQLNYDETYKINLKNYMFSEALDLGPLYADPVHDNYLMDKLRLQYNISLFYEAKVSEHITRLFNIIRPMNISYAIDQRGYIVVNLVNYKYLNLAGYVLKIKNVTDTTSKGVSKSLTSNKIALTDFDFTSNSFYIWLEESENSGNSLATICYPSNIIKTKKLNGSWYTLVNDGERTISGPANTSIKINFINSMEVKNYAQIRLRALNFEASNKGAGFHFYLKNNIDSKLSLDIGGFSANTAEGMAISDIEPIYKRCNDNTFNILEAVKYSAGGQSGDDSVCKGWQKVLLEAYIYKEVED